MPEGWIRLVRLAENCGFDVFAEETCFAAAPAATMAIIDRARGMYDPQTAAIVVSPTLPWPERLRVLAHEVAHALLDHRAGRPQEEAEADHLASRLLEEL